MKTLSLPRSSAYSYGKAFFAYPQLFWDFNTVVNSGKQLATSESIYFVLKCLVKYFKLDFRDFQINPLICFPLICNLTKCMLFKSIRTKRSQAKRVARWILWGAGGKDLVYCKDILKAFSSCI